MEIAIDPHWKLELVEQGPHILLAEAEELVALLLAVHVFEAPHHNAIDAFLPTVNKQRQSRHLERVNGGDYADWLLAATCCTEPYNMGTHHERTYYARRRMWATSSARQTTILTSV